MVLESFFCDQEGDEVSYDRALWRVERDIADDGTVSNEQFFEVKFENASALSYEYLLAFYDMVGVHPSVFKHVLDEVHLSARGQAGAKIRWSKMAEDEATKLIDPGDDPGKLEGAEALPKLENASSINGILREDDESIDTSVVLAREGVFRGTDNEPRLKPFSALQESAKWMLGTPITSGHIPDEILPSTRRIGQIVSVEARPDKRDIFGTARFYKKHLNEDELTRLKQGSPIDGSIGYRTPIEYKAGKWNHDEYVGIESGPFVLTEYAVLWDGKGACSSEAGCGIYQNAAPSLVLIDGEIRKKCPKRQNKDDIMSEELKTQLDNAVKLLNSATEEIKSLKAEVESLTNTKLANSSPEVTTLTEDLTKTKAELATATEAIKLLNSKFEAQEKLANEAATAAATAKDQAAFGEFKKLLNAGHAGEAEALWPTVKALNPVEYEAWKASNKDKLLNSQPAQGLRGNRMANAAGGDKVAEARNAALAAYTR